MSVESAKAFCARMMSDDSFREAIGSASSAEEIRKLVENEKYSFGKADLLKVVSSLMNKEIHEEQLSAMVCEVYEEEIQSEGKGSVEAVAEWLSTLA